MTNQSSKPKIKEKPNICAIDLDQEIIEALQARGLHCFAGTLGSQVKLPNSGRHSTYPCLLNYDFPLNFHEYDIVIVDLQAQELIEYNQLEHMHSLVKGSEQITLLSSFPTTVFDPRPLSSSILRRNLEDFFREDTLIIIFSASEEIVEYYPVAITRHGRREGNSIKHSLYDCISGLGKARNKTGQNVIVLDTDKTLKALLQKYSKDFKYQVVFEHPEFHKNGSYVERDDFIPLIVNFNNEIIGFFDSSCESSIFVLPQLISKQKEFLLEFINEILPELFPTIFPSSDQFSWLISENYFPPNQTNLLAEKERLEAEYKSALVKIEEKIQQNQSAYQFLHNLITETGDLLVRSVEIFFSWLGFINVINMDETNPKVKEEDLQAYLNNGLLVCEIKGIGGTSKDSECSQISKIKYRRARERNSFDVFALYIVNHQRYLPPLGRSNPPFSQQQIADAQSDERGLLTTYELFKLYFYIEEGFVTKEDAISALLKYGLVQFEPSNASLIGYPLEIYHGGKVVILCINNFTLCKGATIIVCNDRDWFKADVLEIQLNDKIVESASKGEIGIRLNHSVLKTSKLWLQNINLKD